MVSVASAILGCGAWSHDSEKFGASEARSQMASSQSACAMPVSFDLMPLTGGTSPSFKLIFDSARTQVFDCACRNALRRGRGTTKQKTFVDQAAAI